jgi:hypothetical protein
MTASARALALALLLLPGLALPARALEWVDSVPTLDKVADVTRVGSLVYVAARAQGLRILDASDPRHPVEIGSLATQNAFTFAVVVEGSHAYLADGFGGLRIVDISNPSAPVHVARVSSSPSGALLAHAVAVADGFAYLGGFPNNLWVIDVRVPSAPALVAVITNTGELNDLFARDGILVMCGPGALRTYDVSNPASPVILWLPSQNGGYCAQAGERLFVLGTDSLVSGRLNVFDISNPAAPLWLRGQSLPLGGMPTGIDVRGGIATIAHSAGSDLYDVSGLVQPLPSELAPLPIFADDLVLDGGRAYIAASGSSQGGFHVVNVADPLHPALLGSTLAGQTLRALKIRTVAGRTYAYLADQGQGLLRIVDATDASAPALVASVPVPNAMKIELTGTTLLVGRDAGQGISIYDVSNPTAPVLRSVLLPGILKAMQAQGTRLYASASGTWRIYDLSNPAVPLQLSAQFLIVNDLKVIGDVAYLAVDQAGVQTYRVADPRSPQLLATVPLDQETGDPSDNAASISVSGGRAYVPGLFVLNPWESTTSGRREYRSALWVLDVSSPATPRVAGRMFDVSPASIVRPSGSAWVTNSRLWTFPEPPGGLFPRLLGGVDFAEAGGSAAFPEQAIVLQAGGTAGVRILASPELATHGCIDGVDDDADGAIDFADNGCTGADDPSERPDCGDGLDGDGDGLTDFPADSGCASAGPGAREAPQCSDGVDNDGDGGTDLADLLCLTASDDDEGSNPPPPSGCGQGGELALLGIAGSRLTRRRRAA